jgi:hypothetical protein
MLGIIAVILLARHIGNLAEDRGKRKWHFWLATVAAWYGGQLLLGLLGGLVIALGWGEMALDNIVDTTAFRNCLDLTAVNFRF